MDFKKSPHTYLSLVGHLLETPLGLGVKNVFIYVNKAISIFQSTIDDVALHTSACRLGPI